jgi:hypothetical protein
MCSPGWGPRPGAAAYIPLWLYYAPRESRGNCTGIPRCFFPLARRRGRGVARALAPGAEQQPGMSRPRPPIDPEPTPAVFLFDGRSAAAWPQADPQPLLPVPLPIARGLPFYGQDKFLTFRQELCRHSLKGMGAVRQLPAIAYICSSEMGRRKR